MKNFFPFINWITKYNKSDFSGDLFAGLTVGVMLIPQGMAYAMLAGMPPIYGLYASTLPLIIYALLGTSRQLAVGPVALVAILISSGLGQMAEIGSPEFISLAFSLAFVVGIIQFLMGLLRTGWLVNFLSHPVISGFTFAAAIIIAISQLKHLLGIKIARGNIYETLSQLLSKLNEINFPTLILGLSSIGILLIVKKIKKRIPGPLIVVLFGIFSVLIFGLDEKGVAIVKSIPEGLPSFSIPKMDFETIKAILPMALIISFVGFMESIAVAKAIQSKHKNYEISPNQELIALGLANLIPSFFQSFPTTGGFSRSAVNDQSGAKTGMASIISAGLIILTLLFLTPYFYHLPSAVLAAIIMVAIFGLMDLPEARFLWKTDKVDFAMFIITLLGTLILGVERGIFVGVFLSLAMMIYKVSYPHIAQLGRIPGTNYFRNVKRFEGLEENPNYLIMRIDAPLFFANLNYIREKIDLLANSKPGIKAIIISSQPIHSIDSSAIHVLHDLTNRYKEQDIDFYFTGLIGPARDKLKLANIYADFGQEHFFLEITDAINYIENGVIIEGNNSYIFQTN